MLKKKNFIILFALLVAFVRSQCNPTEPCVGQGSQVAVIQWDISRAYDVTFVTGGGHRIYYSDKPGVTKSTPNVLNVPNTDSLNSGVIKNLGSGCTIYVRVGAYNALNPAGGDLSPEITKTTP